MKKFNYFFICIIFLNSSCTKKTQVHFHGRAVLSCGSHLPVKNCMVNIYREYDTGSTGSSFIGSTITNNDGYYDLIAEVTKKGDFSYYDADFFLENDEASGNIAHSNNDADDVQIEGTLTPINTYKFHIKNVSPYNSADVLSFLIVSDHTSPSYEYTHITDLYGNMDTVIYERYRFNPKLDYRYSSIKNGSVITVPLDTLASPNCTDTVNVNVFY